MKTRRTWTLNGKTATVEIPGIRRLIDVLREDLGLTGTKEGCGEGECGACTVLLDGEPVAACLIPAAQVPDGAALLTIEGVARTRAGRVLQQAYIDAGAVQCGFCIPGIVMELYALFTKTPDASDEQLRAALAKHYCRCTGYEAIYEGAKLAQRYMKEEAAAN